MFKKPEHKTINIKYLPSQGYFYPPNLKMTMYSGKDVDHEYFLKNLKNSNIFGIIETVKYVLNKRIKIEAKNFSFEQIRAIDLFYIFINFVKFTTGERIYFSGVEFISNNFMYFNFEEYAEYYEETTREYIFDGWRFSLPSIGIESSLNKFSYEITIKGELKKYQNSNYNLIYFLGNQYKLNYEEMLNIILIMDDLSKKDKSYINEIVEKFSNVGIYLLISEGSVPVKISPNMIKEIWPKQINQIL